MTQAADCVVQSQEVSADICVIGGGPAGLSLAAELVGSKLGVLVLEAGSSRPPAGGEPYAPASSVGVPYPLHRSRVRGLGGSAHHWDVETPYGGPRVRLRELDELDFEDRPGVRTPGWPFARSLLKPYYRRARALLSLQPAEGDDDQILPEADTADGSASERFQRRLFSFARAAVFTEDLPFKLAADAHTRVLTDVVVTELCSEGWGTEVTAARARDTAGRTFTVRAKVFVIAAGGIETARLLLASRSTAPRGIGDAHDQVGRYFQEHPHYASGLLIPTDSRLYQHRDSWDIFARRGNPVQFKYGLTDELQRREGLLNVAYFVTPRPATWLVPLSPTERGTARGVLAARHVRRMIRTRTLTADPAIDLLQATVAMPRLARYAVAQHAAHRAARAGRRSRFPLVFTLGAMAEQQPLRDSRVLLTDEPDHLGMPKVQLNWQLGEADAESMRRSHEALAPLLARFLGARAVGLLPEDELPGLGWGYHHMGTTRMSVLPEAGVVNSDLRVHGVSNLYVAGSSTFPAGGSANPTLTIIALSIRLGDLLRGDLRVSRSQAS